MATNEAKVTFRADTANFSSEIKKANSSLRELKSAVRMVDAQMDAAGVSTERLRQKDSLLRQEQAQLQAKVDALTATHRKAIETYGANSTEAQRYATQLNSTRAALAQCESKIRANNTALEDAARAEQQADTALAKLTQEIAEQEHEMGQLGDAYREAIVEHGRESQEVRELEQRMVELNRELQDNRRVIKAADDAADEFARSLDDSASAAERSESGYTVAKNALANLISMGLQRAIDKARELIVTTVELGVGFENSMAKVQALSGATADEYAALEASAREYGSTTRFTASQVADGFGYMALAGWDCESMLSGIPGVLNLAAAAEMDLAQASDIVTDYLTAFGLQASDSERFVDQMTFAMSKSNTNVEQLGEAYKNCAATASSMHYSVEDTTAAIMVMANAGVKGGEAGTALNAIMTRLATDTKGCASELAEYGVQVYDSEGRMQSLSSILQGMGDVWETLTDEQQAAMAKTIAGVNHYSNLQTVMKGLSEDAEAGGQGFVDYAEALSHCSGAAQEMSDIMMDTAQGDIYTMQSALEETGLKLYEKFEKPFRDAIQFVSGPGVQGITWLIENPQRIIPGIVGIGVAIAQVKSKTSIIDALKMRFTGLKRALDTSGPSFSRITREIVQGEAQWKRYNAATGQMTVITGRSTASIRLQQAALKTQSLAMKAGTVAARGLGAAMKTIAPVAIITVGIEIITRLTEALGEAEKQSDGMEAATRGLEAAASGATVRIDEETGALQGVGEAASSIDIDKLIEDHTALASSITETNQAMVASTSMLSGFGDSIEELAGRSDLTEEQVAALQIAVDGVNDSCGTSYTVAQDASGAWQVMADGAVVAKDAVLQLIDAQLAQLRAQASAENYKNIYAQLQSDAEAYAAATSEVESAQQALNDKLEALGLDRSYLEQVGLIDEYAYAENKALQDAIDHQGELKSVMGATQSALNRQTEQQKLHAMAAAEGASALLKEMDASIQLQSAVQQTGTDLVGFTQALDELGFSTDVLASTEPEKIASIAKGWQSGTKDMIAACEAAGIEVPERLREMGDQAVLEMDQAGHGAGQGFTAGLSAEAQSAIDTALSTVGMTRDEFDKLAEQAGIEGDEAGLAFANSIAARRSDSLLAGEANASDASSGLSEVDGSGIGNSIAAGYAGAIAAKKTASGSAGRGNSGAAKSGLQQYDGQAHGWGNHLGDQWSAGLESTVNRATSAGSAVASAAAAAMKFSVPKAGPFSGAEKGGETSGSHLGENFIAGFKRQIPELVAVATVAMDSLRAVLDAPFSLRRLGIEWSANIDDALLNRGASQQAPIMALQRYIDAKFEEHDGTDRVVAAIEKLSGRATVVEIDGVALASATAAPADEAAGRRQALADRGLAI